MPERMGTRTFVEFAGAAGVVLSLIFVGMELRHANNLAEAEAVQSINLMMNEVLLTAMSDELTLKDAADRSDISISEARRGFRNVYFLNMYEAAWKAHERGIIDDEMFSVYLDAVCGDVFLRSNVNMFVGINGATWAEARSAFNPHFVEQLEMACTDTFDAAN
jgi:hypothetical protein